MWLIWPALAGALDCRCSRIMYAYLHKWEKRIYRQRGWPKQNLRETKSMTIRSSRWALFPLIMISALVLNFAGLLAPGQNPDNGIVFKELTGEETGLKGIMEKWKADELQRQG